MGSETDTNSVLKVPRIKAGITDAEGRTEDGAEDCEGESTGLVRSAKKQKTVLDHSPRFQATGDPHIPAHKQEKLKDKTTKDLLALGIKGSRFCKKLTDSEVDAIVDAMSFYEFKAHETIVYEGENGCFFFVVQDGNLEVSINSKVINTLTSGQSFGAMALLYNCPRSATVTATDTAAGIWGAHGDNFRAVLKEHGDKNREQNRALLNQMSLFDGLAPKDKDLVGQLALIQETFEDGARVITEDDPPNAVYFVLEGELSFISGGSVRSSGELEGGRTIGRLRKGDCFGWRAVLYGERQSSSVVCQVRCELVCVGVQELQKVLGDNFAEGLERSFVLSVLRRHPVLAFLGRSQLREIAQAFETRSFDAFESLPAETRIVIVSDGEVNGSTSTGAKVTLKRGHWCHDTALQALICKEEPENPLELQRMCSPVSSQCADGKLPMLDTLSCGSQGCRLATLSAGVLANTLTQVCPSARDGANLTSDEAIVYLRKVMLSKKVPIFQELSEVQVDALVSALILKSYQKGDKVFTQGEVGTAFFVVASGSVAIKIDGAEVRTLGENACFGERAVLFNERRSATVEVASTDAEMWSLEKDTFNRLVSNKMREALIESTKLQDKSVTLKLLKHVRVIGAGSFGTVRLVEHKRTGMRYALKRIRKKVGKVPVAVEQECELLKEVNHPFILRIVTTFESGSSIYILTELITGGQMYEQVLEKMGVLNRKAAQFYIASMCIILEALHEKNIVYRDLKPENVMLDAQGYLKLVDFGLAKKLAEDNARTYSILGTPYYMAPEVIRGQGYGVECDIWSLGVMFFELVCGCLPFGDQRNDDQGILADILEEELTFPPKYTDSAGKRLIKGLLERDVDKRLGIIGCGGWDDIKENKFFKAGFSGDIFQQIVGRELKPPLTPKAETYSDESDLDVTLSDADELGKDDPLDIGCRILAAFKKFDLNEDGEIDRSEFEVVLKRINCAVFTDEVIDELMATADADKDGKIKYDEFIRWVFSDEDESALSEIKKHVELDIRN